jgi:hypothetical protein
VTNPAPVSTLDPMRSTTGKTPGRNIRIGDELWDAAKAKAAANGDHLSDIVRELLTDYVEGKPTGYTLGVKAGRREILDRLTKKAD